MRNSLLLPLLFLSFVSYSQKDSLPQFSGNEDLIESYFQEQESDDALEYNDLFDDLRYLRRRPLDLNTLSENDLDLFSFLTPIQKVAYMEYLYEHGALLSIFEMQAIPHFDLPTIRKLLPFVEISQTAIDPVSENWKTEGNHQLILRWSRSMESKKGFTKNEAGETPFQGDRNALYMRYRFTFSNRLSFGFTAEKDEGESFFKGSNPQGFDFYSAHLFMKNPNGKLRTLALGDYSVSMGQGLVLFNGFSTRKGPLTTQVKRLGQPLRRYSSVNETDFFRGGGATFAISDKLEMTAFYSTKNQDANIGKNTTLLEEEELETPANAAFATSLQNTGKHRTANEIADEKAVRQNTIGSILKYKTRRFHAAANVLYNSLEQPLQRREALYNQSYFNGNKLLNASFDFGYTVRNFHFFGETAMSNNSGIATTNGLIASLDQRLDAVLLFRHFSKKYQALSPKPFAETSGARNETGLYLGIELRPLSEWTINAYFDQWQHQWLRFRTDAPSNGHEWLLRLTYTKRKKMTAHIQIKNEVKSENVDDLTGRFDQIHPRQNLRGRIHLSYHLSKSVEWRSRAYAGFSKINKERLNGVAVFQDLKYKPVSSPISISIRYAIFDTDDYAIRFYAYENDVLNSFTVPAYFDRGSKFYLLLGWKIKSGMLLEGRLARLEYTNRETVGSGLDEIDGSGKTDVKLQLRWNF